MTWNLANNKVLFFSDLVSFKEVEAADSEKADVGEQSTAAKCDIPDSMFIFKSKNP